MAYDYSHLSPEELDREIGQTLSGIYEHGERIRGEASDYEYGYEELEEEDMSSVDDDDLRLPIPIRWLDLSTLNPKRIFLGIGGTQTGKTCMMLSMLASLSPHYHFGIAVSPTPEGRLALQRIMPAWLVLPDMDDRLLAEFLKYCRLMSTKYTEEHCPKSFLYLDDMAHNKKLMMGPVMLEAINNGRHDGIAFFITLQDITQLPPALRGQAHYVFVFRHSSRKRIETIHEQFFPEVDRSIFLGPTGLFMRATGNYRCLMKVYNPNAASLYEVTFVHKVRGTPLYEQGVTMCCGFMWFLHSLFYRDKEPEETVNFERLIEEERRSSMRGLVPHARGAKAKTAPRRFATPARKPPGR